MVFFITESPPRSLNAKSKVKYQQALREEFNRDGTYLTDSPLADSCYTNIVVFHPSGKGYDFDIDNVSKPLVDAFNGILYLDDKLVCHRLASKIEKENLSAIVINESNMPYEVARKLQSGLAKPGKILTYFEVGEFNSKMIKVGGYEY